MPKAGVHSTVYLELTGKGKWFNCNTLDEYGFWGGQFFPDEKSLELLQKAKAGWYDDVKGIGTALKLDEEGYNIRLRRPAKKETRFKTITFGPPLVLDKDGKTPMPPGTNIGNGSDITCNCELYFFMPPDKKQGSSLRLISVRLDNLIPYSGREDMPPRTAAMVGTLDQTAPEGW